MVGWGLPVILTALLLIFEDKKHLPLDKRNPNFVYGTPQAIVAVALLVLCFIGKFGKINALFQISSIHDQK